MATVIDALVVSLNLDASGFSKSAAKTQTDLKRVGIAGDATAKDIGNAAKQMAASINHVRTEVLALFAAFTAGRGIKQLVSDITDGDAATGRLARSVGMATGELATLQEAAKRVGGTAEGVGASIAGLSAKFTEFRETGQGGESFVPALQRMGITLVDNTGKMKTLTNLFLDLAGWAEKKTPQQSGYWLSQLGLDPGTIRLVQEGRAGMQRSMAEARSLGVASDKDAANAQELLANISRMRQAVDGLVRVIINEFSPAINEALGHFTAWITENGPRLRVEIADRVAEIVREVRSFVESADRASTAVGGWVKVSEALFALWAVSKVAGLIGAVAKVGGIFGGGAGLLARAAPALAPLALVGAGTGGPTPEIEAANQANIAKAAQNDQSFADWWSGKTKGRDQGSVVPVGGTRRDQDDFIDRLSHAIGRFLGHDTTMDTGTGDAGITPGEAARGSYPRLGEGAAALPGGEQMRRAQQAHAYFVSQGWTPEQASGIVANLHKESGFNTGAVGDNQSAYGIAQWHGDRRDALAKLTGKSVIGASFEDQLAAVQAELTKGGERAAGDALRQARTAREAGAVVSSRYERPAARDSEAAQRGVQAERFNAQFGPAGAARAPIVAPQRVSALRWGNTTNNSTADNSTTTSNHIGQVVVNTQARNGREVARTIKNHLANMTYTDSRRALS